MHLVIERVLAAKRRVPFEFLAHFVARHAFRRPDCRYIPIAADIEVEPPDLGLTLAIGPHDTRAEPLRMLDQDMIIVARLSGMPAPWSRMHISAKMLSMKRWSRVRLVNQSTSPSDLRRTDVLRRVHGLPWAAGRHLRYVVLPQRPRQPSQLHGLCASPW